MEKTVKLTLEQAKELYNQGGNFKTIALGAYTEEELTFNPKYGDICFLDGWIFIKEDNEYKYSYLVAYNIDSGYLTKIEKGFIIQNTQTPKEYRYATKEEKELLLEKIRVSYKEIWNNNTLSFRYIPEKGEYIQISSYEDTWVAIYGYSVNDDIFSYAALNLNSNNLYYHPELRALGVLNDSLKPASPCNIKKLNEKLLNNYKVKWNAITKSFDYSPSFGDIIKVTHTGSSMFKRNYLICIYPNIEKLTEGPIFNIANLDLEGVFTLTPCGYYKDCNIQLASPSEKLELLQSLQNNNLYWDPIDKKLIKIPKLNEIFYYFDSNLRVNIAKFSNPDVDRVKVGNCFYNKESCLKAIEDIKSKVLKNYNI